MLTGGEDVNISHLKYSWLNDKEIDYINQTGSPPILHDCDSFENAELLERKQLTHFALVADNFPSVFRPKGIIFFPSSAEGKEFPSIHQLQSDGYRVIPRKFSGDAERFLERFSEELFQKIRHEIPVRMEKIRTKARFIAEKVVKGFNDIPFLDIIACVIFDWFTAGGGDLSASEINAIRERAWNGPWHFRHQLEQSLTPSMIHDLAKRTILAPLTIKTSTLRGKPLELLRPRGKSTLLRALLENGVLFQPHYAGRGVDFPWAAFLPDIFAYPPSDPRDEEAADEMAAEAAELEGYIDEASEEHPPDEYYLRGPYDEKKVLPKVKFRGQEIAVDKELRLEGRGITGVKEIEGLEALTELRVLCLTNNQIQTTEGLENLYNLRHLFLDRNSISRIQGLDTLTDLRVLNLTSNQITKIEGLEHLQNLDTLCLENNNISRIEGLEDLKRLDRLELGHNHISRIEGLEDLKQLTHLELGRNHISRIEGLEDLKRIHHLNLDCNPVTGEGSILQDWVNISNGPWDEAEAEEILFLIKSSPSLQVSKAFQNIKRFLEVNSSIYHEITYWQTRDENELPPPKNEFKFSPLLENLIQLPPAIKQSLKHSSLLENLMEIHKRMEYWSHLIHPWIRNYLKEGVLARSKKFQDQIPFQLS